MIIRQGKFGNGQRQNLRFEIMFPLKYFGVIKEIFLHVTYILVSF